MHAHDYNPKKLKSSYANSDTVSRLQAFGFPEAACYEAYWVSGKNEESALSMLFDMPHKA